MLRSPLLSQIPSSSVEASTGLEGDVDAGTKAAIGDLGLLGGGALKVGKSFAEKVRGVNARLGAFSPEARDW